MFGNSLFNSFHNDPFFSAQQEHMRQMQDMHNNFLGSSMFGRHPMLGITPGNQGIQEQGQIEHRHQRDPFGGMFGMFGNMNSMMENMQRQMQQSQNNPNCHSFSSSSVMSYSNTGEGQPKVYQAHSSTRRAPGGVVETRKSVRDSEAAINKLELGHHIGDRGRTIQRTKNLRSGQIEEEKNLLNIEDSDQDNFDREWRDRTQNFHHHRSINDHRDRPRDRNRNHRRHAELPAIADHPRHQRNHHGNEDNTSRRFRDRDDRM